MIHEERLAKILAIIEAKQAVTVQELQETLYFSASTIRRDLAELARRGLVERSFGGAVALTRVRRGSASASLPAPETLSALSAAAAELIEDDSTVFLGASAAVQAMLPGLTQKKGLTVVTDGRAIADYLCGAVDSLRCTGGRYDSAFDLFTGRQAAEFAAAYRYDCALFSCDAVSTDGYAEDFCADRLPVMREVLRLCKRSILICPKEIVGGSAPNILLRADAFDAAVTDAPEQLRRMCRTVIAV